MTQRPDEIKTQEQEGGETEPFLSRWSRLKQETKDQPPQQPAGRAAAAAVPPPQLPPLDQLSFDSDYRAFFHPKVDEDVRRAALKKLFSDPRFNVMDGLDVYIDDYSKSEPIPAAMLAGLRQAQNILAWAKEMEDKPEDQQTLPAADAAPAPLAPPAAQAAPVAGTQASAPDAVPVPPPAVADERKTS